MGKFIDKNLCRLGAQRMYKYGEGDADVLIEDDFNEWKDGIWEKLLNEVEIIQEEKNKNL